jgi:hypothetical protein
MNSQSPFPVDFIHVGVMRGASTWLEAALSEHPQLQVFKSTFFYDESEGFPQKIPISFHGKIGFVNEKYLYLESVPQKIFAFNAKMKISIILRNPLDRLISQYFLYKSNHLGDSIDFVSFVNTHEKGKLGIKLGFYQEQLERYLSFFPKEQVGIFLYDQLLESPAQFIENILSFLEVDSTFTPSIISKRKNVGMDVDKSFIKRLILTLKPTRLSFYTEP